ncbi:MAG: outer membrane lipoprotein-sorting protein [Pseudomonadota bacterium]
MTNLRVAVMPSFTTTLMATLLLMMFSSAAMADKWAHVPTIENATTPEEKGLAIAVAMDRNDTGWGDSEAEMKMVLRRANGQETIRRLRFKLLEVLDDGDKGLTIFDQPRDVQGTTFLNHSHALEPDDQWIYLPALRRVKRISSKNKTGRFMGSEFTYEDMSSGQVEKYDYKYLRDETLNDMDMFVVEFYPKDEFSGYKRQILWVDKEELRNHKIEFYDRRDGLLKVMEMHDYRQYNDKFWRSHKLVMTNQQTGKSTDLIWKDYKFSVGLSDADFHRSVLERAR